jgi:hypothetical protein
MSLEEMRKLYSDKMGGQMLNPDQLYTVRVWDGMDGVWCDVVTNVTLVEALTTWCSRTRNGTKATNYNDIDYYKIYPADTKMMYSGNNTMRGD